MKDEQSARAAKVRGRHYSAVAVLRVCQQPEKSGEQRLLLAILDAINVLNSWTGTGSVHKRRNFAESSYERGSLLALMMVSLPVLAQIPVNQCGQVLKD